MHSVYATVVVSSVSASWRQCRNLWCRVGCAGKHRDRSDSFSWSKTLWVRR